MTLKRSSLKFFITTATFALPLAFALDLSARDRGAPRDRQGSGTYQDHKGEKGTWNRSVDREEGSRKETTTWKNDKGQEGQHQSNRTWDKESKTTEKTSSTTWGNGKTISNHTTGKQNEDGSLSGQSVITGPDGKQTTVNRSIVKNEDGSITVKDTWIGADGKTVTTDTQIQKGEKGYTATGSYTSSAGGSGAYSSKGAFSNGKWNKESQVTNEKGETAKFDTTTTGVDGTLTKQKTITNKDGESKTYSGSVSVDKE
jgi:hypothetical protein